MEDYQLIGSPLGHSLSPQIHEKLFALEGISAAYTLCEFPAEELPAHIAGLKALAGFNVTIPYKQAIIPFLDGLGAKARLYGAVNTVHSENGRWIGYNTDCAGFLQTMRIHQIALKTRVCILGAGGVGRMFAIECARQGAEVTLAVREGSMEKTKTLAAELLQKIGVCAEIRDIASLSGAFGLVINATPVGMFPKTDASPVPAAFLEQVDAVFDCIYNPTETQLLRDARALGKQTAGGMDMLVWQAAAAHELWHSGKLEPDAVLAISRQMSDDLLQKEQGL